MLDSAFRICSGAWYSFQAVAVPGSTAAPGCLGGALGFLASMTALEERFLQSRFQSCGS